MSKPEKGKGNVLLLGSGIPQRGMVRQILMEKNFTVTIGGDADSSEDINAGEPAALVLYIMSRSDARDDKRWASVKELVSWHAVPVVLLSEFADSDVYLRALDAGVSHIISSPCNSEFFVSEIEKAACAGGPGNIQAGPASLETTSARHPVNAADFADAVSFILDAVDTRALGDRFLLRSLKRARRHGADRHGREGAAGLNEEEKTLYIELRRAINNREFILHFQPIVSLAGGSITGFEALIRWLHPEKGLLPPDGFIPLAEKTDLIIALGLWVIEEACGQLVDWQRRFVRDTPLTMSINLSARQFIQHDLIRTIDEAIGRFGLDPSTVRFEITESAFMEDMESANLMLLELKSKKFLLYMDDFGTGYSSLSYLMHFPVDVLKIDKSFVRFMHVDEESEVIVHSVIALAHNLKRRVIAEGVETERHFEILKDLGCDYGQGYYFSRPVEAAGAEDLLRKNLKW